MDKIKIKFILIVFFIEKISEEEIQLFNFMQKKENKKRKRFLQEKVHKKLLIYAWNM